VSQYKISQNSAHWETVCFTQNGKLMCRHYEAKSSFSRYSASAHKMFNAYFFRCLVETSVFFSVIFDSVLKCPTLFSFFSISRPQLQSSHQCFKLAAHDVTESVHRDCRSLERSHIKNRQRP